jgi:hypothetical protein
MKQNTPEKHHRFCLIRPKKGAVIKKAARVLSQFSQPQLQTKLTSPVTISTSRHKTKWASSPIVVFLSRNSAVVNK